MRRTDNLGRLAVAELARARASGEIELAGFLKLRKLRTQPPTRFAALELMGTP